MTHASRPATHRQPIRRQLAITLAAAFTHGPALLPAALPAAAFCVAALLPASAYAETIGSMTVFAGAGGAGAFLDGPATSAKFSSPSDAVFDKKGNLYVADLNNQRIRKVTPAGEVSTLAGNDTADNVDGTGTDASLRPSMALFSMVTTPSTSAPLQASAKYP